MALASSYIHIPKQPPEIWSLRFLVSNLHSVLTELLGKSPEQTIKEQDYKSEDFAAIQHAYDFALTCKSLFGQIVSSTQCHDPHQARLHLSGFKQHQLRIGLSSCHATEWVPVLFTR